MKWVTRENANVDRIACPWLIKRFIDPDAEFLPELTHREAIERGLKVMDTTALSLCMDNNLPIYVFALADGNIRRVITGERIGTIISTPAKEEH